VTDYYHPHPKHIFISILIIAMGFATAIMDGWLWFGVIVISIGIMTAIAINVRLTVEGYRDYWAEIGYTFDTVLKIKDPAIQNVIFEFFGFTPPSNRIQIVDREDLGQGSFSMKFKELPVSTHIMQAIADAVLTGMSFSEKEISNRKKLVSSPKFRKLQATMREQNMLKPNNSKSNQMGFSLTRKGTEIMYQFASESVKQQLKEREQ